MTACLEVRSWGIGGSVRWVWKCFLRGLNPIFMDPYLRCVLDQGDEGQWEEVRLALGVTRRLAEQQRARAHDEALVGELAGEIGRAHV